MTEENLQWGNLLLEKCPVYKLGLLIFNDLGIHTGQDFSEKIGADIMMDLLRTEKPKDENCSGCHIEGDCALMKTTNEMLL